jgi:hypothetical protein
MIPSMAMAGGGNTKAHGKIRVYNKTNGDAYVILDQKVPPSSLADFNRKGGKRIPPGGQATFSGLKAGAHTYGAVYTPANVAPTTTDPDVTGRVNVTNGNTTNVNLNPVAATMAN